MAAHSNSGFLRAIQMWKLVSRRWQHALYQVSKDQSLNGPLYMKLLVVEDDATTGTYIARGLREEGHTVDLVAEGREGLIQATSGAYDVLIVDRMLPEIDGLTLVKTLRGAGNLTPVLFLTAMGSVDDRISGLNAGGDDYLVKPFAFGLKAVMIVIIGIDRDGFATEVEDGLNSLATVQTVILEEQSLI